MTKNQLKKITTHIWKNRKSKKYYVFDYPDYNGLPKKLSNTLSSEAVDVIQDMWSEITGLDIYGKKYSGEFKSKKEFFALFSRGLKSFGENIK